ncbi:hypothetical protein Droror1_Dr00000441 [Drosera rotundifolia]
MLVGDSPMSNYEPYEAAKYVSEGHRPIFRAKGFVPELRELTEEFWAADMKQGVSQEVPEGIKENPGGPSQFIALMPLFDPPRHDNAETIRRALNLGVSVKMITDRWFWFGE